MLTSLIRHCRCLRKFTAGELTSGEIKIEGGHIVTDYVGYFWIEGSSFNDGAHSSEDVLIDEHFSGRVIRLIIPIEFIQLADDIAGYCASDAAKPAQYTAESFAGYSYSRPTKANGGSVGWQDVFSSRINDWRCV